MAVLSAFEQGTLCFHFVLGPTNYVEGSAQTTGIIRAEATGIGDSKVRREVFHKIYSIEAWLK